tara:strand:- start:1135 stop:2001 length:867 start_codon:yes stop_codon:yes gene_type:complete
MNFFLKSILWSFFILIIVPSGCVIVTSNIGIGRWSKKISYEKFQTYYPTKYKFPTDKELCFKNKNIFRENCVYFCKHGPCDPNQITLPIKLEGDASKKRLVEISKFIYNSLPDKKIDLVFIIKGSHLELGKIYNLEDKDYIFATASLKDKTSLNDIEISEYFWNKDEFMHVLKTLKTNLEKKGEVLIGAWKHNQGYLYYLIRNKDVNLQGEYIYRFEYFNRITGKNYSSEEWSSNKKKNEFILNKISTRSIEDHSVKCNLNKCDNLINLKSGLTKPNLLNFEHLINKI